MKKTLAAYGPKRHTVRVFLEPTLRLVRVSWYDGRRMVKSWPDSREGRAEAKAWAKGFTESRERHGQPTTAPLTLRGIWEAYTTAEFEHLRPRTTHNYTVHWRKWETFLGREFVAETARLEHLDQFRKELKRGGIGVTHAHHIVTTVKIVYGWAEGRELLLVNRLRAYRFKVAKEERPEPIAEYTAEERDRILAHLDRTRRDGWRPWVAVMLAGHQGARMNAILHLRWEDVNQAERRVTWAAAFDKTGKGRSQPLTEAAAWALRVAKAWAEEDHYAGPWVFFSSHAKRADQPYRGDSLWLALVKAERKAGVAHKPRRAMHGFRRQVAGDVLSGSRDAKLALDYIGDVDLRQAARYLKARDERLDEAAAIMDRHATVTESSGPPQNLKQDGQARQESNLQPLELPSEHERTKTPPQHATTSGESRVTSPKKSPKKPPAPSRHRHRGTT